MFLLLLLISLFLDIPVEKQTIPSQIFGSLKTTDGEDD